MKLDPCCHCAALKAAAAKKQLHKTLQVAHVWTSQPDHSQNHCGAGSNSKDAGNAVVSCAEAVV